MPCNLKPTWQDMKWGFCAKVCKIDSWRAKRIPQWRCRGSNPGPFTCKANALPLRYIPQMKRKVKISIHKSGVSHLHDLCLITLQLWISGEKKVQKYQGVLYSMYGYLYTLTHITDRLSMVNSERWRSCCNMAPSIGKRLHFSGFIRNSTLHVPSKWRFSFL